MSREIGSYQSNIIKQDRDNDFFNDDIKWFISGRAALDFILKDILSKKRIKKAALPSWCCDSMIDPFIKNKIDICFYSVSYENGFLKKDIECDADVLLYIDYFGFEKNFEKVCFDGIVINDITQSVFSYKDNKSDYVFCSLRKWAGFKTAGFAYAKNGFSIDYNLNENKDYFARIENAMLKKEEYLNYENDSKDYYDVFVNSEEELFHLYEYSANKQDIDDARHLKIDNLIKKRRDNARYLLDSFKDYSIFKELDSFSCPLYVPIFVPDGKRDNLKKYLITKDIYCPTHWAITSLHKISEEDKLIYENELSLICDQRYSLEDMKKMTEHINDFINGDY